ncbi:hypothetical protein F8S13_16290 [Chloroflexia bacterium SDU3-3]|nr:hypothetical protein F8S13_16290 [Chloroflexia bacterium SDU3-3]
MAGQIFIWWLVSTFFGLVGLPLSAYLFRSLPDGGYPFARAFGLLIAGYLAWLLAMIGLAPFNSGLLLFCSLAVLGLGVGMQLTRRDQPAPRDLRGWLAQLFPGWRLALGYELLFAAALVLMALIRARMPDPWGTERPMDFAFFNAIQRSGLFPPHDPWLSGYTINYYYLGYLLMASVALLANLDPGVAFNLSMALLFALTALGVAGVVVNLVLLASRGRAQPAHARARVGRAALAGAAAILSVVFVLLCGNQGGALQVMAGTPNVLMLGGADMWRAVQNGLGPRAPLTLLEPVESDGALTTEIQPADTAKDFNWWNPSRALWDKSREPGSQQKFYSITEFPAFSFWLGDMHPHVMSLPFSVLALALALATLARPAAPVFVRTWRGWAELVGIGVILGSLYAINSWDFPTYLLLYAAAALALHLRLGRPAEGEKPMVMWALLAQHLLLVGMASLLLFAPFSMTIKSLVGSKEPLVDVPVLATITKTVGLLAPKTPLHTLLIIFGLFLVPLLAVVAAQGLRLWQAERRSQALEAMPWVVLAMVPLGALVGFPYLFLLPLGVYALWLALRAPDEPALAFLLLGLSLGSFICLGTDIIYIRDVFEGGNTRMNTIFKFYYQVWLIWGTLAGFALWWLAARWRDLGQALAARRPWLLAFRIGAGAALALTLALLAGALVYPRFTVVKALTEQAASPNGLAGKTPRQQTPAGEASIQWLRDNAPGEAVVLEAVGSSYDGNGPGGSGISASTGLATVLGWSGHESQWRAGDPEALGQLGTRQAEVETIYASTDLEVVRGLLKKYAVAYVYVGDLERSRYDPAGLDKFAQLGSPVFQQDQVVIYQISR